MTRHARELTPVQRQLLSGLLLSGPCESSRFTAAFLRILSVSPGSPLCTKYSEALAGLIRDGFIVSAANQLRPAIPFAFQLELSGTPEFRLFYQYYDELVSDESANPGMNEYRALLHCELLFSRFAMFDETLSRAEKRLGESRQTILTRLGREIFRKGLPADPALIRSEFLPYFFSEIAMRCVYFGAAPGIWLKAGLSCFPKDSIYLVDCALLAFYTGAPENLSMFSGTSAGKLAEALRPAMNGNDREAAPAIFRYINALEQTGKPVADILYSTALLIITGQYMTAIKRWSACVAEKAPSMIAKELSGLLYIRGMMEVSSQFDPETEFLDPEKTHCPFTRMLSLMILTKTTHSALPDKSLGRSVQIADRLIASGSVTIGSRILNAAAALSSPDSPFRRLPEQKNVLPLETVQRPVWKTALEQMAVPYGENAQTNARKFLSWHISASGKDILRVTHIALRLHDAGTDPSSGGRQIQPEKIRSGEMDHLLSPAEKRVREFVKRSIGSGWEIDPAFVKYLISSNCVFLNGAPVQISRGRFFLNVFRTPDGGFKLSAPETDSDSVVLIPKGKNVCVAETTAETEAVFRTLRNCGGSMTVPKEGEKDLSDVLAGLAGRIDLHGELPCSMKHALPYRDISPVPAVRITRLAEGGIRYEMRITDESGRASSTIPGNGFVSFAEDGVLFTRDLAAEHECAAQVLRNTPSLMRCRDCGGFTYESEEPTVNLSVLNELQKSGVYTEFVNLKRISITAPPSECLLSFDIDDGKWLDAGGNIKLDEDHILPLSDLLNLYGSSSPFVKVNENKWVRLQDELCRKLDILKNGKILENGKVCLPVAALPALSELISNSELTPKLKLRVEDLAAAFQTTFEVPEDFAGTLRPYQHEGFQYLCRMNAAGTGCCLADDMGLGKTIQLLAFLLLKSTEGPSLVAAPASVCGNWAAETERFAPSLHVIQLNSGNREKQIREARAGDLLIASYGIITSEQKSFALRKWNIIILDEAQAIKNQDSQRTKAVKTLNARCRVAASGTPVENKLSELWSLFDFLNPGLLGDQNDFAGRFTESGMPLPGLKKLVAPLILRRMKKEVLTDLPEKSEITEMIGLSECERTMYESIRRDFKEKLHRAKGNQIEILAALMKLRRFCCHPSLVFDNPPPAETKLERILELAENIRSAGHRALVFSQFVDFLMLIRRRFEEKNFNCLYLDGSTQAKTRTELVDSFQNGNGDFFLISLKAGGVGLNLTAADYVIITDPWWNPAVEDQAADRAHRIGQKNAVTVYRLITADTVEEKVIRLHEKKRQMSEDILDNASGGCITQEDLLAVFGD